MSDPILREVPEGVPLQDDAPLRRAMKLSEREATRVALRVLRRELGVIGALILGCSIVVQKLRRAPFGDLPAPRDRRDALSRAQAGDAILLWRALVPRVGDVQALAISKEIMTAGGVVFLGELLGDLDASVIEGPDAMTTLETRTGRFFNAEGSLRIFKSKPPVVQFAVSACRFVELLRAASAEPLLPLFCEVDRAYFSPATTSIRLDRDQTLAAGDAMCDFRFRWEQKADSP